jgi:hypothetical protein
MEDIITISVSSLAPEHLDVLVRALTNILSTSRAEFVFAQIIDGLPVHDTVGYQPSMNREIRKNLAPSQEAMNAVKQYRETMNMMSIQLEAKVRLVSFNVIKETDKFQKAQRYQDAAPGSLEFSLRLFELLAVSCHDIAALLYSTTQPGIRQDVQDPEKQAKLLDDRETNFMLGEYPDWQQYPKGVADMVGYWAEYHVFGGVMLFDRRESGFEVFALICHINLARLIHLVQWRVSASSFQFYDLPVIRSSDPSTCRLHQPRAKYEHSYSITITLQR